jgi:leader peptidase (prepilin peptidase)/N-methyltransferase
MLAPAASRPPANLGLVSPADPAISTRSWALPLAATLVILAIASVGLEPRVVPAVYVAVVTPALCASDVSVHRLPNALVLPGYAAAALGIAGDWLATGAFPVLAFVAGVAYAGALLLLSVLGGMGMGDVKLAGVLGFAGGLAGAETALLAPVAAFLLGGVAAVIALRSGRGTSIPFGPYLLAGFWIALLIGSRAGGAA